MGKIVTYNGKVVKGSSGMIASVPGVPAGLPAKTMRFDFHYDHFNPIEGLIDRSSIGAVWTHVADDVYDFHYDNTVWWCSREMTAGSAGGLFNIYAYYSSAGIAYPMSGHQFDVIDSNLAGVTDMHQFFSACRKVTNCVLKNTGDIVNASKMLYGGNNVISIKSLAPLDLHSATDISSLLMNATSLESTLNITLSGIVTDCSNAFSGCRKVPGGALDIYNQLSSQETLPSNYSRCFYNTGRNTTTGAAELAQIPSAWK